MSCKQPLVIPDAPQHLDDAVLIRDPQIRQSALTVTTRLARIVGRRHAERLADRSARRTDADMLGRPVRDGRHAAVLSCLTVGQHRFLFLDEGEQRFVHGRIERRRLIFGKPLFPQGIGALIRGL